MRKKITGIYCLASDRDAINLEAQEDRDHWQTDLRPDQYDRTPTVYADRWCHCGKAIAGPYSTCYACHKEANSED